MIPVFRQKQTYVRNHPPPPKNKIKIGTKNVKWMFIIIFSLVIMSALKHANMKIKQSRNLLKQ